MSAAAEVEPAATTAVGTAPAAKPAATTAMGMAATVGATASPRASSVMFGERSVWDGNQS